MARTTPRPPPTQALVLSCLNQRCPACGGPLWFAYENERTVTSLEAVLAVTLQVRRCVNPACAWYHRPYRPEAEGRLALPHHEFGSDVIAWIGAGRYQGHETAAILILAFSPVLDYEGAGSRGGEGSSRTGTTRPGSKLRSMNVIKSSQLSKHR
jgi:hypothetical protein